MTTSTKKTTTKSKRRGLDLTALKVMIVAGSMMATFIGANELAQASPFPITQAEPITTTVQAVTENRQAPGYESSTIPQLDIPEVVTRSRSSK